MPDPRNSPTSGRDPDEQREIFIRATELLGGLRATGRILGIGERTMRGFKTGEYALHDRHLRDVSAALIALAVQCREVERQLNPGFSGNLTAHQRDRMGKPDARRFDAPAPQKVRVKDPASLCEACGRNVAQGHRESCPNEAEPWPVIEAELD